MANMVRFTAAVALDRLAEMVDALTRLGVPVVIGPDDGSYREPASQPEREPQTPVVRQRTVRAGRRAAAAPAARGAARSARSVYTVTAKGKAEISKKFPHMDGNRAWVLRSVGQHDGEGMGDHQRRLAGKVKPKSVDGSIFYLRQNGFIRSIDAK